MMFRYSNYLTHWPIKLAKMRERLQRYYVGSQHALRAVIDDYFPQDILELGLEGLTEIIAQGSRRRFEAKEKARVVYQAAQIRELELEMKRLLPQAPWASYLISTRRSMIPD